MTTDERLTAEEIKFDRSLLGVEHPGGRSEVTREAILTFCQAVGETNPIYTDPEAARAAGYDDIIAPPTFCNLFVSGIGRPDIKLEFGDLMFHAGQAIDSLAPIKPGDTLEGRTALKEVYTKTGRSGTMVFIVWETKFINQDGTTVAAVRESFVRRNRG